MGPQTLAPTYGIWITDELAARHGLSLADVDLPRSRKATMSRREYALGDTGPPRIFRCRRHPDRRPHVLVPTRGVGTGVTGRRRDLAARYHDFEPKLIAGLVMVVAMAALYLGGSLAPAPWRDRLAQQLGGIKAGHETALRASDHHGLGWLGKI
jgi:hypothetical protein